jgi:hypothetical protein
VPQVPLVHMEPPELQVHMEPPELQDPKARLVLRVLPVLSGLLVLLDLGVRAPVLFTKLAKPLQSALLL